MSGIYDSDVSLCPDRLATIAVPCHTVVAFAQRINRLVWRVYSYHKGRKERITFRTFCVIPFRVNVGGSVLKGKVMLRDPSTWCARRACYLDLHQHAFRNREPQSHMRRLALWIMIRRASLLFVSVRTGWCPSPLKKKYHSHMCRISDALSALFKALY